MASKNPYDRSETANTRAQRDHAVLADPDIRGARRERRGQHDDVRSRNGNSPEVIERAWKREGRG